VGLAPSRHIEGDTERHSAKLQASQCCENLPIPFHSQLFCTARRPSQPLPVLLKLSGHRGIVKDLQRQRSSAFGVNGLVVHRHCRPVIRMWAIHLTTSQQELPEVQFRHHRTGLAWGLAIVEILNSECQAAVHIPSRKPNNDEFGAKAKRKQRHTLVDVKHKLSSLTLPESLGLSYACNCCIRLQVSVTSRTNSSRLPRWLGVAGASECVVPIMVAPCVFAVGRVTVVIWFMIWSRVSSLDIIQTESWCQWCSIWIRLVCVLKVCSPTSSIMSIVKFRQKQVCVLTEMPNENYVPLKSPEMHLGSDFFTRLRARIPEWSMVWGSGTK